MFIYQPPAYGAHTADDCMEAKVWGTRGSYPVARPEMLRYGGNTACVEVRVGITHIVLDAGTGLRQLGQALLNEPEPPQRIVMFITHTHWDHIIGFPFFEPLFHPQFRIDIFGLQRTERSLHTIMTNALSDPLLPFGMEDLRAELYFHEITTEMDLRLGEDVVVSAARANHPYRALGYRIESPGGVLCFIPDTGPFHTVLFGDERIDWSGKPTAHSVEELSALEVMRAGIVQLAEGADWLIYDSQFTSDQYACFPHWGHSTPEQAMEIALAAQVRELLLFHHDPHRTDDQLDAILADQQAAAKGRLGVRMACEGMLLRREACR